MPWSREQLEMMAHQVNHSADELENRLHSLGHLVMRDPDNHGPWAPRYDEFQVQWAVGQRTLLEAMRGLSQVVEHLRADLEAEPIPMNFFDI
jgi:hypothetical protein